MYFKKVFELEGSFFFAQQQKSIYYNKRRIETKYKWYSILRSRKSTNGVWSTACTLFQSFSYYNKCFLVAVQKKNRSSSKTFLQYMQGIIF
jgi:hypothetical protein